MAVLNYLQIGSGEPEGMYRRPPWVNVDIIRKGGRGAFVQASGSALPFRDDQFLRVHAIHVLEHLPREFHLPMLREIARVLAGNGAGYAFVEVPDFIKAMREMVHYVEIHEAHPCDELKEAIRIRTVGVFGKGRHFGDFHHWGFAPWYLEKLIQDAGMRWRRDTKMISNHYRGEPVLLYRCWK